MVADDPPADVRRILGRAFERIATPASMPPVLTVVVDTEEEFDWSSPIDRTATSVNHIGHLERFQSIFDRFCAPPTYVVDYPVVADRVSAELLGSWARDGRAVIGAHLHAWVNPPFDEVVSRRNSFQGNLPAALEAAKIRRLRDEIAAVFGSYPVIFKAGRYGIGPNTYQILEQEGFQVDLSPAPPRDYSSEGGPDFSRWPVDPFWFGTCRALLCLPCTGAFVGWFGRLSPSVYGFAAAHDRWHVRGLLARARAADRLGLSPEGFTLGDMRRLAAFLVARGTRVLTMSLHSPSCCPGHTPYVRDDDELDALLGRISGFLGYFARELGGVFLTVPQLHDRLSRDLPPVRLPAVR